MPHSVNRAAFLAAKSSGQPLLSAYCQLVATELALKDNSVIWPKGHDVPKMLDDIGDPGITSLSLQLRTNLAAILCTNQTGNESSVSPDKYPDLRYARHIADHHVNGITDNQFQNLVRTIEDIIVQLRAKGVAI